MDGRQGDVTIEQFQQMIEERGRGTYWRVYRTTDGLRVEPDKADARWRELRETWGRDIAIAHDVRLKPDGTFSILDHYVMNGRTSVGHVIDEHLWQRSISFRSWPPKVGPLEEYEGGEGRRLVESAGRELGLRQVQTGIERGARIVGAIGLGIAAVTAVLVVIGGTIALFQS